MERLDWSKLLNGERRKPKAGPSAPKKGEHRIELERDYDRLLFSTPVRRLADKTQVFPLDPNDSVRTRLTHSHEVANLARGIGTALVYDHRDKLQVPETLNPLRSIPSLLGAISLAHDLGNPPFGHQGEEAIRSWVKRHSRPKSEDAISFDIFDDSGLTKANKLDFLNFEGNAQSLRLLTRLQILNDDYGLNMSYAFLAALMKYPVGSDKTDKTSQARKKFNFFQSEAPIVKEVWEQTGLSEGVRHPLTCVMEACDDIAYSILDIEDAAKKGLVSFHDVLAWLRHVPIDETITRLVGKATERDKEYRTLPISSSELSDISMQMLRVDAIGSMVTSATEAFVENIEAILSGEFDKELIAVSGAANLWRALKSFGRKHAYSHRSVLEVELEGHRTIHALMDDFWKAIRDRDQGAEIDADKRTPFSSYVFSRISENYRRAATRSKMPMRYCELQLITDMISGMTDSYAISLRTELERLGG